MFRKNYFTFFLAIALFTIGSLPVFAQSGLARGKVELKKADGTVVPVAGVTIDIYRTDMKGKIPPAETNKKGEFTILGLISGGRYALSVSAPNIRADVFPDIKSGDEKLTITVVEGDGKRLTEEEARQILESAPKNTTAPAELTAEQKKEQQELAKKNEQIMAGNKKIENINAVVRKSVEEGNKAYNEKNYDLAITRYDEGINVDPDFAGTAAYLLNRKAESLVNRAIVNYNAAIKGDPTNMKTALEPVRKDLTDMAAAANRSLQLLKSDTTTLDAAGQKRAAAEKNSAYANLIDAYSRMLSMNVDATKGKDALLVLEEYSAIETDAARKAKTQATLADALSRSGDLANAVIVYRKVLETTPDNPDALGGLGLALVGLGSSVTPANTAMMQEGLNLMQRFTEVAPDNHSLKVSVKEAVDYLKTQQLTPQKTTKSSTKKKT